MRRTLCSTKYKHEATGDRMGGGVVDIGTREHEIFDHLPKPKVSHAREVRATGSPTFPPSGRKTRGSAGANTGASQVARADGGVVVTWSVVARPDLAPQWGDEPLSPGLCVPSPPNGAPKTVPHSAGVTAGLPVAASGHQLGRFRSLQGPPALCCNTIR